MIGSYRHNTGLANRGKVDILVALFPAFRSALGGLCSLTRRELLAKQSLMRWRVMPEGTLPFQTMLSARQMKSAQNMTHTAVSSWQESLVNRVRDLITGCDLSEHRKTVLYRINAGRAWWAPDLELPWLIGPADELVQCTN